MMLLERPSRPEMPVHASLRRPLRVLLITDHLGHANGVIHGASRYYLQVLPRLDPSRVRVSLSVLRGHHPFAHELEAAGVTPIFLDRAKWDPRALRDLGRLAREMQADVLHCLAMKGSLFGRIIGKKLGIPALIHLHDTNPPGLAIGALQRSVAPWTARALAVSERVADFAVDTMGVPRARVEVLYNGLDIEAFASPPAGSRGRIRDELGIAQSARVMVLAGRVIPGKGQRELIEAMPHILRRVPEAVLLIAGEGPDLRECKALAAKLGLESAVRFAGQRPDMPAVLAAADLGVMPSLADEGFGYAALEAAAAGKPVVAFDTGALRRIVDDGSTGLIVDRGDMDGLTEAMLTLLNDPERCIGMGERAIRHVQRFGIRAHVARLEQIYAEVARDRRAGDRS